MTDHGSASPQGAGSGIRTILLALDETPESEAAVAPTVELARRLGAQVILLTVVADDICGDDGFTLSPASRNAAVRRTLAERSARLQALAAAVPPGVPVRWEVVRGESVPAVITSFAEVRDVSMIALASHRRSGLPRLLLGSVTGAVVRRAVRPVLVFPAGHKAAA